MKTNVTDIDTLNAENHRESVIENLTKLQEFIAREIAIGTTFEQMIVKVNAEVYWADWMADEEIADMMTNLEDNPYLALETVAQKLYGESFYGVSVQCSQIKKFSAKRQAEELTGKIL